MKYMHKKREEIKYNIYIYFVVKQTFMIVFLGRSKLTRNILSFNYKNALG